ncbi:MAG: hypothetical protein V3R73_04845, partial [Sphingomonadales bacterium]
KLRRLGEKKHLKLVLAASLVLSVVGLGYYYYKYDPARETAPPARALSLALEPLDLAWERIIGGPKYDFAHSIAPSGDGGFVVAGQIELESANRYEAWVFRLDAGGGVLWQKTFGGPAYDIANSVTATADGGFVVAGHTYSKGAGAGDLWVFKLDGGGKLLWEKTFGGAGTEDASQIIALSDGGFAVAGYTNSQPEGSGNSWVLRLDSKGGLLWEKYFEGASADPVRSIVATGDGGFALAGYTRSKGAGGYDFRVLRLDRLGGLLWDKTFGGTEHDYAFAIAAAADGGFAVAGQTASKGAGLNDVWVLKLDASGELLWEKTFGRADVEEAKSIVAMADGGFLVAAQALREERSGFDLWLLRLDSAGELIWEENYGGPGPELIYQIIALADGSFALAAATVEGGAGKYDAWIVKLQPPE